MSKARQLLLDLNSELQGQLLTDTFTVNGRDYELKLLSDTEQAWVFSHINAANSVILALTAKTASLSVGIRSINGCEISDLFEDELKEIQEKRDSFSKNYDKMEEKEIQEYGEFLNPYDGLEGRYLTYKLFFDWLGDQPSVYIDSIYKKWQELTNRQSEMQETAKKSLPGSLENGMEQSSTEASQDGESSTQVSG